MHSVLPVRRAAVEQGTSTITSRTLRWLSKKATQCLWDECLSEDVVEHVYHALTTCGLAKCRGVSRRWRDHIEKAWPRICAFRFPALPGFGAVPTEVLWQLAKCYPTDDERVVLLLSALAKLQRDWPGAVRLCSEGINNRMSHLTELRDARPPADAALFFVLGASLESASPVGTLHGDFGEFDGDFDDATPREPWRISMLWPSPAEALLTSEDAGAQPSAGVEGLLCLGEFGRFLGHAFEGSAADPELANIYNADDADSQLLVVRFAGADADFELMGYVSGAISGGGLRLVGLAMALAEDGIVGDEDFNIQATVEGQPMSVTGLLECVVSLLAPHLGKRSWDEAWHSIDLYGGLCSALDPPTRHGQSSVEDGAHRASSSEEEEEEEDDDEYPASMLADGSDEDVDDQRAPRLAEEADI